MSVIAGMTTSVDGYVAGPDDAAGRGLGVGGERLHYWVMGGPWTYATEHEAGAMTGADKEFFDDLVANFGAGVCGRGMYDAAGAWGHQPVRRGHVRPHPSHERCAGTVVRLRVRRRSRHGDGACGGRGGGS